MDQVEKRSGQKSVKIAGSDIKDSGKEICRASIASRKFDLLPRTEYKLSFWYGTSPGINLQQNYPPVWVLVLGGKVDWGQWNDKRLGPTDGNWVRAEATINHLADTPEETNVQLRNCGEGAVWFDDIRLERVGDAEIVLVRGKTYAITRHREEHPTAVPTTRDKARGYLIFSRDNPSGIYPNSYPAPEEIADRLVTFATLGEYEPVTFARHPLKDLTKVNVTVSELVNEKGERLRKECMDFRSQNIKCVVMTPVPFVERHPRRRAETGAPVVLQGKPKVDHLFCHAVDSRTPRGPQRASQACTPSLPAPGASTPFPSRSHGQLLKADEKFVWMEVEYRKDDKLVEYQIVKVPYH